MPTNVVNILGRRSNGQPVAVACADDGAILTVSDGAAMNGRTIDRWVNNRTPGAVPLVLTYGPGGGGQPGIYYNLAAAQVVYLSQIAYGVVTVSDFCSFELGYTDAVNGGGTFIPLSIEHYVVTSAAPTGRGTFPCLIQPHIRLRYADGVRSITFRVDANDAGCGISCGFRGWYE